MGSELGGGRAKMRITMFIAHIRMRFLDAFLPRLSEWACAGVLFVLGVVLTVNPSLMDMTKPGYRLMLSMTSQENWAAIMMIGGGCRIAVLTINGAWARSPHARALSAFATCFVWCQITLSFQPVMGFAFVSFAGWWITDTVNVLRATRDARTVDNAIRAGELGGH